MATGTRRLVAYNIASATVAFLVVVYLYLAMRALAAFAAGLVVWPMYLLVALGLPLSVLGLTASRGNVSRLLRAVAYVVNGFALLLHTSIVAGVAAMYFAATEERYLIPEGFKGDVYVIYNVPSGKPANVTRGRVVFEIPADGVLRTQGQMARGLTRTRHFFVRKDGSLERISNYWPTTIHPAPENLANDRDLGVYFERTGQARDFDGCSAEYGLFYVGTKAHLLKDYKQKDIMPYLRDASGACGQKPSLSP